MNDSELQDRLEDLVLYLSETDAGRVPLACFDCAEPLVGIDTGALYPLHVPFQKGAACSTVTKPVVSDDKYRYLFRRTRFLQNISTPSWARRYRHAIAEDFVFVNESGSRDDEFKKNVLASADGQKWFMKNGTEVAHDWDVTVRVSAGIIWRQERTWRVLLGFGDGPRISLETGPSGAKEIFRLRDIPEGKRRRAALRHWVRQHWRNPEGDASLVRKHLRGATDFTWKGLRGRVSVPTEAQEAERVALEKATPIVDLPRRNVTSAEPPA